MPDQFFTDTEQRLVLLLAGGCSISQTARFLGVRRSRVYRLLARRPILLALAEDIGARPIGTRLRGLLNVADDLKMLHLLDILVPPHD